MTRARPNRWLGLAVLGGSAYPVLVYFGMSRLPPGIIVLIGVGLIGMRMIATRHAAQARVALLALAVGGAGLAVLLCFDAPLAIKGYPVAISLATAATFGLSLIWPPSLVERIARITDPDLSSKGVATPAK